MARNLLTRREYLLAFQEGMSHGISRPIVNLSFYPDPIERLLLTCPAYTVGARKNSTLTPWTTVLTEKLTVAQLPKNPLPSIEPEGSLPCSKQPASDPYQWVTS
jgi:hypothetical protein